MDRLVLITSILMAASLFANSGKQEVDACNDQSKCVFEVLFKQLEKVSADPVKVNAIKLNALNDCAAFGDSGCLGKYYLEALNLQVNKVSDKGEAPTAPVAPICSTPANPTQPSIGEGEEVGSECRFGTVISQYGDAIYTGQYMTGYLGRVAFAETMELVDRRVYKGKYGEKIVKVKVAKKVETWTVAVGSVGFVNKSDVSFGDHCYINP